MGYRIVTYSELRDKNVLVEMCKIHNKVFNYDGVDAHSFLKFVTEDPNSREDMILVALDVEGCLLGFLVGVDISREPAEAVDVFKDIVWIKDFAVDLDLGRGVWKSVGLDLVRSFRDRVYSLGKKNIILYAYAPFYFMPGINILYEDYVEFFEELGFRKESENVNYEVDLSQFYYPRRVAKLEERMKSKGILIRRGTESEVEYVVRWVKEIFSNPFWGTEVFYAFRSIPPSILLAEANSKLVGFAVYTRVGRNEFGPIGVDQRFRGFGIGTILLFKALSEMKLMGYKYATITWTTHLFFYAQVPGIVKIKHYLVMSSRV